MERALRPVAAAGSRADRLLLRWLPWLLAVALHLGLAALWPGPGRPGPAPQAVRADAVMQVVQLWPLEAAAPARPQVPGAPGVQRPAGAAGVARARAVAIPLPARPADRSAGRALRRDAGDGADVLAHRGEGAVADAPTPPAVAPARGEASTRGEEATAAAAATEGAGAASLLDTPASRRALRAVAAGSSARALSDAAAGVPKPLSAEERLGRDVARAARGDCLKGEFFGGGAGLLSLPFWVAAEASGKCRR